MNRGRSSIFALIVKDFIAGPCDLDPPWKPQDPGGWREAAVSDQTLPRITRWIGGYEQCNQPPALGDLDRLTGFDSIQIAACVLP
jgi:hypothetical protein